METTERLTLELNDMVRYADRARDEFVASVADRGVIEAIAWIGTRTSVTIALGDLARETLRLAEDPNKRLGIERAVDSVRRSLLRQLLSNSIVQSSTDQLSNAMSVARAGAAAAYCERFASDESVPRIER